MSNYRALITGVEGQDGKYLSDYLLEKGYGVYGVARYSSRPKEFFLSKGVILHTIDVSDSSGIEAVIKDVQPDHIYNLAAVSHVGVSFNNPLQNIDTNGSGLVRILEAVRRSGRDIHIYQAGTSEMFGPSYLSQNEETPFNPKSPYAAAKVYAHHMACLYREAYGMHVSNGILFNHESPHRGHDFVTRKITRGLARIKMGHQDRLHLGNLDAVRDWGHARDYVRAMHLMVMQPVPGDFVIATGETHSVREFVSLAAEKMDMPLSWSGTGLDEIAIDKDGKVIIDVSSDFFRPLDVHSLCGDATRARKILEWKPTTTFEELVQEMVTHDLKEAVHEYKR